jgi:DNA polymerase-3 subunit gamma/tau
LADRLGVGGIPAQLAHNCTLVGWDARELVLGLDPAAEQLRSPGTERRLREALEQALGGPLTLEIRVTNPEHETPAQRRTRERAEREQSARDSLEEDPVAQRLRDQLDAQWVAGSIEPTD